MKISGHPREGLPEVGQIQTRGLYVCIIMYLSYSNILLYHNTYIYIYTHVLLYIICMLFIFWWNITFSWSSDVWSRLHQARRGSPFNSVCLKVGYSNVWQLCLQSEPWFYIIIYMIMYIYIYIYTHIHTLFISVYIYVFIHIYIHIYTRLFSIHIYLHICIGIAWEYSIIVIETKKFWLPKTLDVFAIWNLWFSG